MTLLPQNISEELLRKEYCRNMRQYWPELLRFTLKLIPHRSDAEEVLQEASLVLWRKYDEFETGSNFLTWAKKVVFFEVLTFRKKKKQWLHFSSELVEELSTESFNPKRQVLVVHDALERCMLKLSEKDQNLVRLRYQEKRNSQEISEMVKRSVEAIYKAFGRIRIALRNCIQQELSGGSQHE